LANFRLGKLDEVRRFDVQKWLAEHGLFALEELPETNTRKNLEANILLAHGVQADTTGQDAAALKNYSAAARIVPTNGLIAYFQARSLKRAGRKPEALHAYARAVTFGQGKIAKNAKSQIVMWPAAEQKEALQEAAKLKQP
jgi:tetratricopeptide (TPR) repeat protein